MEELGKLHLPMGRELDGLAYGVQQQTEDDFSRGPTAVSFQELLQGHSFVPLEFRDVGASQYLIDGVEEMLAQGFHASATTLSQLYKIVYEDISLSQGTLEEAVGRRGDLFWLRHLGLRDHLCKRGVGSCTSCFDESQVGLGLFVASGPGNHAPVEIIHRCGELF